MSINAEFIERYQLEYQKNPRSKVFAPLAEGYRRMGLLKEAHEVAEAGVKYHPEFASGRVAFGRILMDLKKPEDALEQLKKAAELSPDNWMAHSMMGDLYLQLRRPKEALKAFKMVLFLHPADDKARKAVQKWEFLTADEYDDDLFEMKPVFKATPVSPAGEVAPPPSKDVPVPDFLRKQIDRALSLADAFTIRNELAQAIEVLQEAQRRLGAHAELVDRLGLLSRRFKNTQAAAPAETAPVPPTATAPASVSASASGRSSIPVANSRGDSNRRAMPDRRTPSPAVAPPASAPRAEDPRRKKLEMLLQRIQDRRLA